MKKLLTIFCVIAWIAGATSCQSTYFFSSLKTMDGYMEKAGNGDFLLDGDSLRISYSFKGQDAPMKITIFNKMHKPLYVDWANSALVVNDIAYSYSDNLNFSGNSISVGKDDTADFITKISPNRLVHCSTFHLNVSFDKIKKFKSRTMGDKDGKAVSVENADFSPENTPLLFSSYLATYTSKDNPIVYQQDFYISNLIKTNKISPRNLPEGLADRGDIFYVEKQANTSFLEGLLGATLVVGAIAVEAVLQPDEY